MKGSTGIKFWGSMTVSEIIDTIIEGDLFVLKSFRNTVCSSRFNSEKYPAIVDAAKLVAEFKLYSNNVRKKYRNKEFKLTIPDSTV